MAVKTRDIVLVVSAVIIVALVLYKRSQTYEPTDWGEEVVRQTAPLFEALDSDNKLLKFERYVGRHQVLLAFFDAKRGVNQDPLMRKLHSAHGQSQRQGIIVVAVSTALPQENRKSFESEGEFPFPILSDPGKKVYEAWGVSASKQPPQTLFWINRSGLVEFDKKPIPIDDFSSFLDKLTR